MKDVIAGILIWILVFLPGMISVLFIRRNKSETPKERAIRFAAAVALTLLFVIAAVALSRIIRLK